MDEFHQSQVEIMKATLRKAIDLLRKNAERFGMLEIDDKPVQVPKTPIKPSERGSMLEWPGRPKESKRMEQRRMRQKPKQHPFYSTKMKTWIKGGGRPSILSHKIDGLDSTDHNKLAVAHAGAPEGHRDSVEDIERNAGGYHNLNKEERAKHSAHSNLYGLHDNLARYHRASTTSPSDFGSPYGRESYIKDLHGDIDHSLTSMGEPNEHHMDAIKNGDHYNSYHMD